MSNAASTVAICLSVLTAAANVAWAGPLAPPAGPVTPTSKTLTEVEPRIAVNAANTPGDADSLFKITQAGSYYLTGNITGVVGKHGVEITSGGVTLDLGGFDLAGIPAMGAFDGVSVSEDSLRNITVRNGSVRNWGDGGVDLGFVSFGCRVEGVLASGNAGTGINAGVACTLTSCTATFNGQRGIRANNGSTLSHCSAYSNTGAGIEVNHGCAISNCSAQLNTGVGILTGVGCTVVDCSARSNTGNGFQLGDTGVVTRCSALSNNGNGVSVAVGCTVAESTANFNALAGIRATDGASISRCSAFSNSGDGISVDRGCNIANCSVVENAGNGVSVILDSVVADCTARQNSLDGIRCGSGSIIRGNTCAGNSTGPGIGAGIHVVGGDTHIEANNCTLADRGIAVDFNGNIIIRNTCASNTVNWVIAADNYYGPIINRAGVVTAAVNGPAAAGVLNSTDPHANFSY